MIVFDSVHSAADKEDSTPRPCTEVVTRLTELPVSPETKSLEPKCLLTYLLT